MKYDIRVENLDDLLMIRTLQDNGKDFQKTMRDIITKAHNILRDYAVLLVQDRQKQNREMESLDAEKVQAEIRLLTPGPDDAYPVRLTRPQIERLAKARVKATREVPTGARRVRAAGSK